MYLFFLKSKIPCLDLCVWLTKLQWHSTTYWFSVPEQEKGVLVWLDYGVALVPVEVEFNSWMIETRFSFYWHWYHSILDSLKLEMKVYQLCFRKKTDSQAYFFISFSKMFCSFVFNDSLCCKYETEYLLKLLSSEWSELSTSCYLFISLYKYRIFLVND